MGAMEDPEDESAEDSNLWRVVKACQAALLKEPLLFEVGPFDDRQWKKAECKAEIHPDRRPAAGAAGKIMNALESVGIDREGMAKCVQWSGHASMMPCWRAFQCAQEDHQYG